MEAVRLLDTAFIAEEGLWATDALNQAVMARYGSIKTVPEDLGLRHDNGSIFLARNYIASTKYWGITQDPGTMEK